MLLGENLFLAGRMWGAMERAELLLLLFGLLSGALLFRLLSRWYRSQKLRARFRRARRKEAEAAKILERYGFTVLASQVEGSYALFCDGAPHEVSLRADYLVEKRGKLFIAEAKSGAQAPDVLSRGTRRQLLEYSLAYDVDGVLLVDTEEEAITQVSFPERARGAPRFAWGVFWGALLASLLWVLERF